MKKDISKKTTFLKYELRNYLHIKNMLDNNLSIYDNKIKRCKEKIKELEDEINSSGIKCISFDNIPSTCKNNKMIQLIYNQDKQNEILDACEGLMLEEKDSYAYRIKYIEDCLAKLTEKWETAFVIEYYCKGIAIENINHKDINYSASHLYKEKDILIEKMLS